MRLFVSIWKYIRNARKDTLTMKKLFILKQSRYKGPCIYDFLKVFWPSHLPISNIVYIIPIYSAENSCFHKALSMLIEITSNIHKGAHTYVGNFLKTFSVSEGIQGIDLTILKNNGVDTFITPYLLWL